MATTPGPVDAQQPPRYATDPIGVICEVVLSLEPALDREQVAQAIAAVVKSRRARRALARELHSNPALLTNGRSHGLRSVELLIPALRAIGARRLATPRCPDCGQARRLDVRRGQERICRPCSTANQPACTGCGNRRTVSVRDHLGRPYCQTCQPDQPADPVTMICELIGRVAPSLPREQALAAIEAAIAHPFQRARTAATLADHPALLTGQGAQGTPRIIALIEALLAAGAEGIVRPPCPACGSDRLPLRYTLDGQRCCKPCYTDVKDKATCAGCQQHVPVQGRDLSDRPLCHRCRRRDPSYHGQCSACGRVQFLHRNQDRLCRSCFSRPAAACSDCGKTKPCDGISTGQPRCDACAAKLRTHACTRCAKTRRVYARGPQGQPLCRSCGELPKRCRDCRRTKPVWGRSASGEPLCRTCYPNDPVSMAGCLECGQVCRLFHHGLCPSCARKSIVDDLLAEPDGKIRAEREPLQHTLLSGEPGSGLGWLQRPRTKALLAALLASNNPLSHQSLDELVPARAVRYLRAILVANGALPPRDEHLAVLERELPRRLADIPTPAERSLVKSFFTWHHLRRLRRASTRQPISYGQLAATRRDIASVVKLLDWLRTRNLTLATCTQADIDHWLDEGPRWQRQAPRAFLLWAARHRHCGPIEIPPATSSGTYRTIEDDARWRIIKRLLHDDGIDLTTRVAGLLLLLFGQPISRIVRLTTNDLTQSEDNLTVALGPVPLALPPPLDTLIQRLRDSPTANHRADARARHWLFTGYTSNPSHHHLSSQQLAQRLKQLGIHPRPGQNTALVDLAAELPAAVLAKLLGLHPNTATRWNSRAGSPRAEYAAELAQQAELRKNR